MEKEHGVLKNMEGLDQIIDGIIQERDEIHSRDLWSLPEPLSRCMTRLAVRNHQLAEYIAKLEMLYKTTELNAYTELRKNVSQGDAEKQAKKKALEAKEDFEHAKIVYKATAELIGTIQSRLKVLAEQSRGNQ